MSIIININDESDQSNESENLMNEIEIDKFYNELKMINENIPKYIANNEIMNEKSINISVFMLVNVAALIILSNIIPIWNDDKIQYMYYNYCLVLNLFFAELIFLIKVLFQKIDLPYEIICHHFVYKYIEKIIKYTQLLYVISFACLLSYDINSSQKYIILEVCYYLIFIVSLLYDGHIKNLENSIKIKYGNNNEEIVNKAIVCIMNIIENNNVKNYIKGDFIKYSEYIEKNSESNDRNNNCVICLESFIHNNNILVTHCDHVYHQFCIIKWLFQNRNCPICREKIV
jgi:hypothetical protein